MKSLKHLNLFLLLFLFSPFTFGGNPNNKAECTLDGKEKGKKISLHYETFETSVWTPKEKEPIYIDYNEDFGNYTVCQKKSPYVSKFLTSFQELLKNKKFLKNSLSGSLNPSGKKMSFNILSSPYVCVSYNKKGYEYKGAFILSHEQNRFPSPTDNGYEMMFLPLSGKAPDGNLGNPKIETFSEFKTIRKKGKNQKILTKLFSKPKLYGCHSLGSDHQSDSQNFEDNSENNITSPELAE